MGGVLNQSRCPEPALSLSKGTRTGSPASRFCSLGCGSLPGFLPPEPIMGERINCFGSKLEALHPVSPAFRRLVSDTTCDNEQFRASRHNSSCKESRSGYHVLSPTRVHRRLPNSAIGDRSPRHSRTIGLEEAATATFTPKAFSV